MKGVLPEDEPSSSRRRLVMTPTVERNVEAAALSLCQEQPLLLEGPPGMFAPKPQQVVNKISSNGCRHPADM